VWERLLDQRPFVSEDKMSERLCFGRLELFYVVGDDAMGFSLARILRRYLSNYIDSKDLSGSGSAVPAQVRSGKLPEIWFGLVISKLVLFFPNFNFTQFPLLRRNFSSRKSFTKYF